MQGPNFLVLFFQQTLGFAQLGLQFLAIVLLARFLQRLFQFVAKGAEFGVLSPQPLVVLPRIHREFRTRFPLRCFRRHVRQIDVGGGSGVRTAVGAIPMTVRRNEGSCHMLSLPLGFAVSGYRTCSINWYYSSQIGPMGKIAACGLADEDR